VRVILAGGGELLFCVHHARQHEDSLRRVAVKFQDETELIDDAAATPER
jgi:hypothetical protein